MPLTIILNGANGKMGQAIQSIASECDIQIAHWGTRDTPYAGSPEGIDAVVDFSLPLGTLASAGWAAQHHLPFLSGVTGLSDEDLNHLKHFSKEIPLLVAPNFSLGIHILKQCLALTASLLKNIPTTAAITETHHSLKKDAPSGTALSLLQYLQGLENLNVHPSITSLRTEAVIGKHDVSFHFPDEHLSFTHHALNRKVFARGALRVLPWLIGQPPGYYTL